MEYTKGPWKWTDDALVDKNREEVVGIVNTAENAQAWLKVHPDGNQTLIQSAPDMYEALRGIINDLPTKRDCLDPDLERIAKDALAKAEGKEV